MTVLSPVQVVFLLVRPPASRNRASSHDAGRRPAGSAGVVPSRARRAATTSLPAHARVDDAAAIASRPGRARTGSGGRPSTRLPPRRAGGRERQSGDVAGDGRGDPVVPEPAVQARCSYALRPRRTSSVSRKICTLNRRAGRLGERLASLMGNLRGVERSSPSPTESTRTPARPVAPGGRPLVGRGRPRAGAAVDDARASSNTVGSDAPGSERTENGSLSAARRSGRPSGPERARAPARRPRRAASAAGSTSRAPDRTTSVRDRRTAAHGVSFKPPASNGARRSGGRAEDTSA